MADTDLRSPTYAHNMRLLGHSDQGGRPDGQQIMVQDGFAYIGHVFSGGFTVVDVKDPRSPKTIGFHANPPFTWSLHLQVHGDLLLQVHGRDMFSHAGMTDDLSYYKPDKGGFHAEGKPGDDRGWSAGMAVFDISTPGQPRQIGFMPTTGMGLHRIWYVGGRWAYASALPDGFTDDILIVIDMQKPEKPEIVGRYWLPGMHHAGGETPNWPSAVGRYGLHHAVVHDDVAYCAWRDACLVVVDVSDKANPKQIAHRIWAPPFGGGTHNCLPLPDRDLLVVLDETVLDDGADGLKPIWLFDISVKSEPKAISAFPAPSDRDYFKVGGHFGPHNVHENRPGSFVSSELIFATYQNAGLRAYDIRDARRPVEVGALVPAAPAKLVDPRPGRPVVLHSADVFADRNGLLYCTDWSGGGLNIVEYQPK